MQLDTPDRGFSFKTPGPLDMRMNPNRGQPASAWLRRIAAGGAGRRSCEENADEPYAAELADALAGRSIERTSDLTGTDSRDAERAPAATSGSSPSAASFRPCGSR